MSLDWPASDEELLAMAARRSAPRKSSRATNPIARRPFSSVTIVVPLDVCASDNGRYILHRNQKRLVLHPDYRAAKEAVQAIYRRAMLNTAMAEGPVEWEATVHFENNRRDLQNASKLLCDSGSKIIYRDDKQITRAVWHRGENDPENPRVEITVTKRSA